MADKAISELIAANQVTQTDLFVLEQNGTAKKLTGQTLENWLVSFADGHGGIQSIKKVSTSGLKDTYRITLADTTTFNFVVTNGRSINSIAKTSTSGLADTYTITYNDGTTSSFTVKNGKKGDKGDNTYTWIKYASQEPTDSSQSMGDIPDDWIGIYYGDATTAPSDFDQYKWYRIKGDQGNPGTPATLVGTAVTYQASTSGTIAPSGEWLGSVPTVPQGNYLWTKIVQTFNTGTPVTYYSVARAGMDGSGSVGSVNGVSPDSTGNVTLRSADIGAGSPYNLLDNSNFTNPVNQRGKTSYKGLGYTIDRWKVGNSSSYVTIADNGVTFSANGGDAYPRQIISSVAVPGKTYTAAVCAVDGTVAVASGVYPADGVDNIIFGDSANISDAATISLRKEAGALEFRLKINDGNEVTLKWAAIYEGKYTAETLPDYQPKGYAVELNECKRYCQVLPNALSFRSSIISANTVQTVVPTGVPMRVSPSIEVGSKFAIVSIAFSKQENFEFVIDVSKNGYLRITASKTGHGLNDACLRCDTDVVLSADL